MSTVTLPGASFTEHHVDADCFGVRSWTGGEGESLVMRHDELAPQSTRSFATEVLPRVRAAAAAAA